MPFTSRFSWGKRQRHQCTAPPELRFGRFTEGHQLPTALVIFSDKDGSGMQDHLDCCVFWGMDGSCWHINLSYPENLKRQQWSFTPLIPAKIGTFFTSPLWICFNESPPFMVIEWVWYLDASKISVKYLSDHKFIHEGWEVWKDMNVSSTSFVFQEKSAMLPIHAETQHAEQTWKNIICFFCQLRMGSNIFQQIPSWRCLDLWF